MSDFKAQFRAAAAQRASTAPVGYLHRACDAVPACTAESLNHMSMSNAESGLLIRARSKYEL